MADIFDKQEKEFKDAGFDVICSSPLEIQDEDDPRSKASGHCAEAVLSGHKAEDKVYQVGVLMQRWYSNRYTLVMLAKELGELFPMHAEEEE